MENEDHDRNMSYAVAHTIRNPIMIIGGFVRSLKKNLKNVDIPTTNANLDFLESAIGEAKNLEGILDELLTNDDFANWQHIERSIEFMPQYYQAGLSILSYFSTIVSQKYPEQKITVKIQQSGNTVKLIITTKEGNIEEIEKTLDKYGQVIKGEIQPEDFCLNPFEVMSLKNKLEIAALELRQAEQLHRICEQKNTERICSLEYSVKQLQNMVADGIRSSATSTNALREIFIKYNHDTDLKHDFQILYEKISEGISSSDEQQMKQLLTKINSLEPNLFSDLKQFAMGAYSGASGNFLYTWILEILK